MGCPLVVTMDGGEVVSVTGNTCKRGEIYGRKEVTNPTRIVTSTVRVSGGSIDMVSVKTKEDIPKGKIFDCVKALKTVEVAAPVHIGDVIMKDVAGTGVDVVATGASNQNVNDGYSHWMKDAKGWWLRYSDGTWPMADRTGAYHWEKINGKWWAFDETGYVKTGWLRDEDYGGWFYMDPEHGMQTGWVLLNGVWYYFNPISDGKRGIMYAGQRTPDGYYVEKNGVWDGRNKQ